MKKREEERLGGKEGKKKDTCATVSITEEARRDTVACVPLFISQAGLFLN